MRKKIRYDRIIFFLLIVFSCLFLILFNINITNIYISNNYYLKDQEIIDLAGISSYPKVLLNTSNKIKNRLESNVLIKSVKVSYKNFKEVYIEIFENNPIFYYDYEKVTVLSDGSKITDKYTLPTVLNYIGDNCYNDFVLEMSKLDISILNRISEIKFDPNDVDDNRFLLTMSDGNYVYINIKTFNKLNKYIEILESLPDKNGILYLDYGNNFDVFD